MGRTDGVRTDSTDALLRASVVAIEVRDAISEPGMVGTGFLVAPRVVVTCAHVIADCRDALPAEVTGYVHGGKRRLSLVPVRAMYHMDAPDGLDLAFLWVADDVDLPYALLSGVCQVNDPLMAYGHPLGNFRLGQSAIAQYAGPSLLGTGDTIWEAHRVYGIPVSGGFSGSPVLNLRTGAVRGMLCTSDERGSAHMVGAEDILAHLPEDAAGSQERGCAWLVTLTDEQLHLTGWRYPGPRLRAYLEAAERAALVSASLEVTGGPGPTDLPTRYVEQAAILTRQPDGMSVETAAESVFSQDENALVTGGPGMGKSTLLRMGLIGCARAWLSGPPGEELPVPVLVQAVDLVGSRSLSELIADSAGAGLSQGGVVESWPAGFFAAEPAPRTRWLVLVDGLDNVLDSAKRREVLTKLGGIAKTSSACYQFVIASRPLPAEELAQQEPWLTAHYRLRPFDSERLRRMVESSLQAMGLPDADQSAKRLVSEFDRARMTEVARTPLLAIMLCQLQVINPDRPLPASLAETYEQFVEALLGLQYVDDSRGVYLQVEAAFRAYGPDAVSAARDVLNCVRVLLGRLALARREGDHRTAGDLLVEWAATRPPQIKDRVWREFLMGILRRSGLLAETSDGDFRFIHDSIADYLAASAAIADEQRSQRAFDELFYRSHRPLAWVEPTWQLPNWPYSYTRFLIALWPHKERTTEGLRQVALTGGLTGCEFVLSLADDGIVVGQEVRDAACAALVRVAAMSVSYGIAARRALALLAGIGAIDSLADVLTARQADDEIRLRAAIALAEHGDARGGDTLFVTASDKGQYAVDRFNAWAALRSLDPAAASSLLPSVFPALTEQMGTTLALNHLLGQMGHEDGMNVVTQIATSTSFSQEHRKMATALLELAGDKRAIEALALSASNREVTTKQRDAALAALAKMNTPDADATLWAMAHDKALSVHVRLQVMTRIARQGRPASLGLLASLAADTRVERDVRIGAIEALAEAQARDRLLILAAPRDDDPRVRMAAVDAVIARAGEVDTQVLLSFARDPQLDPSLRMQAAQALDVFERPEAPLVLAELAEDESLGPEYQRFAAGSAIRKSALPRVGKRAVAGLARQEFESKNLRIQQESRILLLSQLSRWPAIFIGGVADPNRVTVLPGCLDELAACVNDESYGPLVRWSASVTLRRFEYPREQLEVEPIRGDSGTAGHIDRGVADLCLALLNAAASAPLNGSANESMREIVIGRKLDQICSYAENPRRNYYLRRYSAEVIARLGDKRGRDVLNELIRNPGRSLKLRREAAASLARAGDPRGYSFLRDVTPDQSLPKRHRSGAYAQLAALKAKDPTAQRIIQELGEKPKRWFKAIQYYNNLDVALGVRTQLADSPTAAAPNARGIAARTLAQFGDAEAISNLAASATDAHNPFPLRRQAITSLALQGAQDALAAIAEDASIDSTVRFWAAREATWLANPRAGDVLLAIVGDESVDSYTRRKAALFLEQLGDPRGTRRLVGLATDPASATGTRQTAIDLLTQMRYVEELESLIFDPAISDEIRFRAIDILSSHDQTDALLELRRRGDLPISARQQIAEIARKMKSRKARSARR